MTLDEYLPEILAWCKHREQLILETGLPLTESQLVLAGDSGVKDTDRVRLLSVERVLFPDDKHLVELARACGMPLDSTAGRAIGYGVEVVHSGTHSERLLRHEFRHVYQYESNGGVEVFLEMYLRSVIEHGYLQSPWEQDARRYEHVAANDPGFLPHQP